jgi:hypothetical protein
MIPSNPTFSQRAIHDSRGFRSPSPRTKSLFLINSAATGPQSMAANFRLTRGMFSHCGYLIKMYTVAWKIVMERPLGNGKLTSFVEHLHRTALDIW